MISIIVVFRYKELGNLFFRTDFNLIIFFEVVGVDWLRILF